MIGDFDASMCYIAILRYDRLLLRCGTPRHLPCTVLAIYRYAVLHEERASNESDRIFDIIHSIKRSTLGAVDRVLHTPIEHSNTMDNTYTREERDTSGGKGYYVIQYYTIPKVIRGKVDV